MGGSLNVEPVFAKATPWQAPQVQHRTSKEKKGPAEETGVLDDFPRLILRPENVLFLVAALALAASAQVKVTVMDRPEIGGRNAHDISNREPLEVSRLIKLPIG